MKVGELFTRADVVTEPCPHCGDPSVVVEHHLYPRHHFEVSGNGAKTAWPVCRTGAQAALFGAAYVG